MSQKETEVRAQDLLSTEQISWCVVRVSHPQSFPQSVWRALMVAIRGDMLKCQSRGALMEGPFGGLRCSMFDDPYSQVRWALRYSNDSKTPTWTYTA
jgi:hypothetical protein